MHPDSDPLAAAQTALAGIIDGWLARRGVVSIEIARRWRGGAPTDEVGIRVTVERLLPPDQVPEGQLFPDHVDGVPVDVVEGSPPEPEG